MTLRLSPWRELHARRSSPTCNHLSLLLLLLSGLAGQGSMGVACELMARKKPAKILTEEDWAERLHSKALLAGAAGATPAKLGRPRTGSPALGTYESTIGALIERGVLARVTTGAKQRFYAKEFAPPPPMEQFRCDVLAKAHPGIAWLEDVLAGRKADAADKRDVLGELVREGRLRRIQVITGARSKKTGYLGETGSAVSRSAVPDWTVIEAAARAIAAARFDHTVSFEALAQRLGVTPLVVKTAVSQRMASHGGLQLVRGEARQVSDPATVGLESGGDVYFLFRFLDERL